MKTSTRLVTLAAMAASLALTGTAFAQTAGAPAVAVPPHKGMVPRDKPLWVMFTHDLPGKRETVSPEVWKAHLESDIAQEKDGTRVLGGGISDKDGKREFGMIIFRAKNYEDAKRIAEADPAVQAGERTVDVHQWQVNEGHMTFSVNFSDSSADFK